MSGEVIPTMMQEMNISTLKLADGLQLKLNLSTVLPFPADKKEKEEAFKWLRENGPR